MVLNESLKTYKLSILERKVQHDNKFNFEILYKMAFIHISIISIRNVRFI